MALTASDFETPGVGRAGPSWTPIDSAVAAMS